jgi:hypothetical protein
LGWDALTLRPLAGGFQGQPAWHLAFEHLPNPIAAPGRKRRS